MKMMGLQESNTPTREDRDPSRLNRGRWVVSGGGNRNLLGKKELFAALPVILGAPSLPKPQVSSAAEFGNNRDWRVTNRLADQSTRRAWGYVRRRGREPQEGHSGH